MRFSTLLTPLTLATTTLAAPFIVISNECSFTVWVTPVSYKQGPTIPIGPLGTWAEPEYFDGIGTAVKITRSEAGLYTDAPVLHLSYTYHPGENIYYDLSSDKGFAFWGNKLWVHGEEDLEPKVSEIIWSGAPQPQQTEVYFGETDLTLVLCSS